MMLRAPETEALYEGIAQEDFGVPSIDGSPVPLDSTALPRSLLGHIALEKKWRSPNATESKPCGSRGKTTQNKLIPATTNNHRGTSGVRSARI
jgi:hypothetical protein